MVSMSKETVPGNTPPFYKRKSRVIQWTYDVVMSEFSLCIRKARPNTEWVVSLKLSHNYQQSIDF